MGLISEIRSRARHVVGPVLAISAVGYFAYHAIHGERSLNAWRRLDQRIEAARGVSAETAERRRILERRVRLLNPASLDPDMLEERARLMLNYGYPDDIVIITAKP